MPKVPRGSCIQSTPTASLLSQWIQIDSTGFGKTTQFTAVGQYSAGSTRFLTATAKWSSSNTSVATVGNTPNHPGLATTKGIGVATLTAAVGKLTATATLTVTQPSLVSISVTPANPTIRSGTEIQFTATGTYSDGTKQNLSKMSTWESSSPIVATITATGEADALSAGSTTISATVGSVSGSTLLTVQ